MNNKSVVKIAAIISLVFLSVSTVSAELEILKPGSHTDTQGVTSSETSAYDFSTYDESTSSTTTEPESNNDPNSIEFYGWETQQQTYVDLNLSVTVSSSGFNDDTWALYYDATADTTCDSTDSVLKASGTENLANPTNYTVSLPANQNLQDLQVCLTGTKNGGPDARSVSIYDIRTKGFYDSTAPKYRGQQQNTSLIGIGDAAELSVEAKDNINLSSVTLATDETGVWENRTVYDSPQRFYNTQWNWANFTWDNSAINSGTVNWKMWVNDTSSNYNVTPQKSFEIDRIRPTIDIYQPKGLYGESSVNLKVTADEQVSGWSYSLDGAVNESFTPNSTISGLSDGSHTVRVWAKDSAENWNYSEESFTVDTTPPDFTGLKTDPSSPLTYDKGLQYQFNATVNDPRLSSVRLQFDGANYTPQSAGSEYYDVLQGFSAGSYSYRWFANDTLGNANMTKERTFDIQKAPVETTLWLNSSRSDREYLYGNRANLSSKLNVSEQIYLWDDLGGELQQRSSGTGFVQSLLDLEFPVGQYTVKGVFFGNENYTERNQSQSLTIVDNSSPRYLSVSDDSPGRVYQGEKVELRARWSDNYELDLSTLSVNSSGQFANVSVEQYGSDGWANFSYTPSVTDYPGLLGWRQWANDTSSNHNLTPIQTQEVWGYSWSNISLGKNSINVGDSVEVACRVDDINGSSSVQDYPVDVYNGTVKIDQGLTGQQGWYNTTFTPQKSQDNVDLRCATYEDTELQYKPVLNGSEALTVNQGEPPKLYDGFYGINETDLVAGDKLEVFARWNDSLDASYVEYTSTSDDIYQEDLSAGPFPSNYTNFTVSSDVEWFKGEHSVKIYANDSQGNLNNTLERLKFNVSGFADVNYTGPEKEAQRGIVRLKAGVEESNTSESVEGYNVSYWNQGTRLGYNTTNSTGTAVYNWNTTNNLTGEYSISVNISDSRYYFSAKESDNATINLTGVLKPVINVPEGIVHRNNTEDLEGTVYTGNGSEITASARWLNYSDDLIDSGLEAVWDISGTRELGNTQIALNVSRNNYLTNETVRNLTVYGYSLIEDSKFEKDRILQGEQATYRCQVGAEGNSQNIQDYPVEFYNSTGYMGTSATNSTGWASFSFNDYSAGNETIQCRIYDNSSLNYNTTSSWVVADELETVDTTLPDVSVEEPGNDEVVVKSKGQYFNSTFVDNLDLQEARYSINASGTYQNVSSRAISGKWNYSDYNFTDTSFEGVLGYRVYGSDIYNNHNRSEGTLTIYGGSDLHRMDLNTSTLSPGSSVKATCGVRDNVTENGISGYPVEFYNGTQLLDTGTTDTSGIANFTYSQSGTGDVDLECRINDDTAQYYIADKSSQTRTASFRYGSTSRNYTSVDVTAGKLKGAESSIDQRDSRWLNWTELEDTSQKQTNMMLVNSTTEIPPETVEKVSYQWDLFRKVDNFPDNTFDDGGEGTLTFSNSDINSTWFYDSEYAELSEQSSGNAQRLTQKGFNFYLPETEAETVPSEIVFEAEIVELGGDAGESLSVNLYNYATGTYEGCATTSSSSYTNVSCRVNTGVADYISTDEVRITFNDTASIKDESQTVWRIDRASVRASYQNPGTGNTYGYTLGYRNRSDGQLTQVRSFDPSGSTQFFSANTTENASIAADGDTTAYLSYFINNTPNTQSYRKQEIGVDSFKTDIRYQVSQTKDYSVSIKDAQGNNISGVNYTVLDGEVIDSYSSDGSRFTDRFAAGKDYTVRHSLPDEGGQFNVTYWNLSVPDSVSPDSKFLPYQQTGSELAVDNASSIYAIDDSEFDFDRATIRVPKNGTPNVIMHCTDFDFSSSDCNSWEVNRTSDYPSQETQDYFQFNVTGFDAFGVGDGKPLPNITEIRVYDTEDAADAEKGGSLVDSGLNKTFSLDQQDQERQYRFEFLVENQGTIDWDIAEADTLYHDGLNATWDVGKTWYNVSGQKIGGELVSRKLEWNTSKGGVLRNEDNNDTMWAKYVVNVSTNSSFDYSQEFKVNDTSENAGSIDRHRLEMTKYGFLDIDLREPPEGTTVTQNYTFPVNATLNCRQGICGDTNMSVRYNESSTADTLIPETDSEPFYTNRTNTNRCDTGMEGGDSCFYSWDVNATGPQGSIHLIDVNSSSSYDQVPNNDSEDHRVGIEIPSIIELQIDKIDFGVIDPGQEDRPATGNDDLRYNVTVPERSARVEELWVKSDDLKAPGWENPSTGVQYTIFAENVSYSDENDISTETPLSNAYQNLASSISAGTNYTTFYWMDVPEGIKSSQYNGTIYFKANETS